MLKKSVYLLFIIVFLCIGCSKSTDDLIKELDSENPITRTLAATKLMSHRKDPETRNRLVDLLDSDNERLVFLSTQILGSFADTTIIDPIGLMTVHSNPYIREMAARSLGTLGHETALEYLTEALDDSVSGVRHAAVMALGGLYFPPASKYIFKMFRDPVDSVRTAAVQALYMYRNHVDAGILAADFAVPLKDKSDLVRYVTVQALGWASPGGYPDSTVAGEFLIEALKDQHKHVRIEAIASLRKNRYRKAVPYLKKMYDTATVDEEVDISEAIKIISGEDFPPTDEE